MLNIGRNTLIVAAFILGSSAAFAQAPPAGPSDRSGGGAAELSAITACDEAQMAAAEASLKKMNDGAKKTSAMKEMAMAREMMMKKDLAACKTHMTTASGMMR
jgi:hypothetical protein